MTARASPPPAETSIVLARKNSGEAQGARGDDGRISADRRRPRYPRAAGRILRKARRVAQLRLVPLTDDEFKIVAGNVAPYLR